MAMERSVYTALAIAILLPMALVADAQTTEIVIKMRSGDVRLRQPAAMSGTTGASTLAAAAVQQDSWRLYLVWYPTGSAKAFRNALVAGGGKLLEFVGDNTVLVYARVDEINSAAAQFGALMADYLPQVKVSPEASLVIQDAAPAAAAARRRRLLQSSDPSAAADSTDTTVSSPVMDSLLTWSQYKRSYDDDSSASDSNKRPPAPPSAAGGRSSSARERDSTSDTNTTDTGTNSSSSSGPELYAVNARLVPGLPHSTLETVVRDWPELLAKALGRSSGSSSSSSSSGGSSNGQESDPCLPRVVTDGLFLSTSSLHVYLCAQDLEGGIAWLSNSNLVMWLEPMLAAAPYNTVGGWIMQTGALTTAQYKSPATGVKPYWNANLQGQGVVVGVTDDGLDLSQCYFLDDHFRVGAMQSSFVGNPPRLYMPYHRKVVQYVLPETAGVTWFGSMKQGHGSQVVGSIAGALVNSSGGIVSGAATGAAPQARISFFGTSKPDRKDFYVPAPLDDKVLPYHYGVGARISSESWGRSSALGVAYISTSRAFDAFAWRNADFLSVVAAGNFGENGMVSVTAPGTAKNVLTVGSTVNYPKNTTGGYYNAMFYFRYRDAKATLQESGFWPRKGTSITTWLTMLTNKDVPIKLPNPESACSTLVGNYTGSIVLLDLAVTTCATSTSTAKVVATGAAAILYIVADDLFVDEQSDLFLTNTGNTAYALISRAQGTAIRSVLKNATNTNATMTCFVYPSTANTSARANMGIDTVTSFSSFGPLYDNRIKPDIVAPGGPVLSAYGQPLNLDATSDTCTTDTMSYQSTSTSTALTSGHLALMRQYFRDGFYPTGSAGNPSSMPFEPSGMLLKAAAIAGAESLTGGLAMAVGKTLGAAPDGFQGWGRLDMTGALPLPGTTAANFRISVADYGTVADGEYIYLKGLKATGTGPIVATLVWHDYPSGGMSVKDLVNDLDFGFLINPKTLSTTFNRTRIDNSNNVERLEITGLKANDLVTLVVYGKSVRHQLLTGPDAQLPQRWAVFAAGHFTGRLKTQLNPTHARPQRVPDKQVTIWLNGTSWCAGATTSTIAPTTSCVNNSATVFTLFEEKDPVTGGYLYMLKDYLGRCWWQKSFALGGALGSAVCNSSTAANQKFAFFQNPYSVNGTAQYQLVPAATTGNLSLQTSTDDRRCLRQMSSNLITLQLSCSEDDALQNIRLERPSSLPAPPPLPAPSAPPLPSPQGPPEPWYPYPLLFRTDFYPVGGQPNQYDYDYTGPDFNQSTYSNLDILVSWNWAGSAFKVTIDNYLGFDNNNVTSVNGAVHGGDNVFYGSMYEEVHWQIGYTPPPTTYDVCVVWWTSETPLMRVKMSVFRGNAVATVNKVYNTSLPVSSDSCDPSSAGYVGSYVLANDTTPRPPPSPPSPPSPPIQLPASFNYPLVFRADWTPISGVTGRENQLVDMEIAVVWSDANGQPFELGYDYPNIGGGQYGGDNMDSLVNYEYVYWPGGASAMPPQTTFHVCVRWYDQKMPLMGVTFSVFRGGLVSQTTAVWDTTLSLTWICDPTQAGYLGNYTYRNYSPPPRPPPPPPQPPSPPPAPSNCLVLPTVSSVYSLYVRAHWSDGQELADPIPHIYDWDLVLAWSYGGRDYVVSPSDRFVAGAVHSGDNMELPSKVNDEAVYWPTGYTGQAPQPTTYHSCVRWYQSGSLNVTITVAFGDTIVKTLVKTWSSNTFHSKVCSPTANGYVGSFNYTATASNNWWSATDPNNPNFVAKTADGGSSSSTDTASDDGSDASSSSQVANQQAAGDSSGSVTGASISRNSSTKKTLAIALSSALGGAGVAALVGVVVVRWRRERLRNTRVVAT